jgi:hypothetical protein
MMQFIKPQGMGNQQDSAITPTAVDRWIAGRKTNHVSEINWQRIQGQFGAQHNPNEIADSTLLHDMAGISSKNNGTNIWEDQEQKFLPSHVNR